MIIQLIDGIKNEFERKKDNLCVSRAAQFLRVISDSTALTESQNLSMFLATNDKIRTMLKTSLAQIEGYLT
jgi:hypothetical protein